MISNLQSIRALALSVVLFAGAAVVAPHSAAAKGSAPATSLFPSAHCAVLESLESSRNFLDSTHSFLRPQGIFPWPGVSDRFSVDGIWVNSIRGTYAVLQQVEHESSPRYGALQIRFYSACDHTLFAEGTRILSRRDWERPEVSIPIKNHGLKGSNLRAYIKVNIDASDRDQGNLEIQIREARVGTRDHFFMGRFE